MKQLFTLTIFILISNQLLPSSKVSGEVDKPTPVFFYNTTVLDNGFPIRSFSISIPPKNLALDFIDFVKTDLIPSGFNNIILRINWAFNFKSRPELADVNGWDDKQIKELVDVCRRANVTIVPLMNLLGHQSWHGKIGKLLEVYPEFDEKLHVTLPQDEYRWPNADRLYCKSYCPNHPDVHQIVFDCVDEVVKAFEAKNFHAGMDEVFDIADINCSRCAGLDPAVVFANEINKISDHLSADSVRLWIWADRLIDGRRDASGYGEWSASIVNTHRAIDYINKSVMMCDWHYRDAEQSAVYFAIKGFDVITCGWERADITKLQLEDMLRFRNNSSKYMSERFKGYMQTVWSSYSQFIDEYRNKPDKELYAAKNYRYLKELYREYAQQLLNSSKIKKQTKIVFGE